MRTDFFRGRSRTAKRSPGTGAIDYSAEDDAAAAVEQLTQVRECTPARAVEMSASLAPPSMKMRFRNAGFVGIDTAKNKHALAIADPGRDGEIRYLGEIDSAPPRRMRRRMIWT